MSECSTDFVVIIPSRYASTRLPGKPLLDIGGKSLIRHVCDQAQKSQASQVIVATDDTRIADHLEELSATVVMTSSDCQSGTDRIAQAAQMLNLDDETVVVNLQGDEPFMPAEVINQIAQSLINNPQACMSTGCEQLVDQDDWYNPNVVKVARDKNDFALYFSRSLIPFVTDKQRPSIYKHLGIYAYRVAYIKMFSALKPCEIERSEKLEQLRALHNGDRIVVTEVGEPTGIGVDTPEDLQAAINFYQQKNK